MLKEIKKTRQIPGERPRRWFTSISMDLIVWYKDLKADGFELCYDKELQEKSVTWNTGEKLTYSAISAGENVGIKYKETPIHVPGGTPDFEYIKNLFLTESQKLPVEIKELVLDVLLKQHS